MPKVKAEITPPFPKAEITFYWKNPVENNPTNLGGALRVLIKNNNNYKHK